MKKKPLTENEVKNAKKPQKAILKGFLRLSDQKSKNKNLERICKTAQRKRDTLRPASFVSDVPVFIFQSACENLAHNHQNSPFSFAM